MSIKIEATDFMLRSLDSLKITTLPMHKLYFELSSLDSWYAIMRDARAQFGKNWQGQPHVRRRLERERALGSNQSYTLCVWFKVPDPRFGTWIAIKHAVRQVESGK